MEDHSQNNSDITELICQLQQEKLLVAAERSNLVVLNEDLYEYTNKLIKAAWINSQQRVNLNSLVIARPDYTPEQCCRRSATLANCNFIEAKEVFDYQTVLHFGQFLSLLRNRTEQLAQWLVIGERLSNDSQSFCQILHSIIAGLYGSLLLPDDTSMLLSLLRYLARFQLVTTDNPRRLLGQGSCAFSKMYLLFHEGLPAAKLFLIATLQQPIINLIANSQGYLDVDPDKTLQRLTAAERFEKFGQQGTAEYDRKIAKFRKSVFDELSMLVNSFICSVQDNIYCFPSTLAWLIRHIIRMISQSFGEHSKEVNAISTDLIFTLFICPAIVHPEPYGICDAPISLPARHNLMQVAQLLQTLALAKFETGQSSTSPATSTSFNVATSMSYGTQSAVTGVIDSLLERSECLDEESVLEQVVGVRRPVVLFTEIELNQLVSFLLKAHNTTLQDLGGANETASSASEMCNITESQTTQPCDQLFSLLTKLPTESNSSSPRGNVTDKQLAGQNGNSPTGSTGSRGKRQTLINKVTKGHLSRGNSSSESEDIPSINVLIIPLIVERELIGLLPEHKVLAMNEECVAQDLLIDTSDDVVIVHPVLPNGNSVVDGGVVQLPTGQEKRTRFSNMDEGSIGNTSDNLEAISEAASNHSVASSIELENEDQNDNDNLSDMVSANVSGRGSPNISGRDTPSSQVTENEDVRPMVEPRPQYNPSQQHHVITKHLRSDIDDKFCKFEIKKLLEGDETISIISDTWSTDVLASDSETIDAASDGGGPLGLLGGRLFSPIVEQPLLLGGGVGNNPLLDISETQSESAWSMDVLASDTERMTEVDNDDLASVAPSDDTASVAPSDDTASVAQSETDDSLLHHHHHQHPAHLSLPSAELRKLSTASGDYHPTTVTGAAGAATSQSSPLSPLVAMRRESAPPQAGGGGGECSGVGGVLLLGDGGVGNGEEVLRPVNSRSCSDMTSRREAIMMDGSKYQHHRSVLSEISPNIDLVAPQTVSAVTTTTTTITKLSLINGVESSPTPSAYQLVKNTFSSSSGPQTANKYHHHHQDSREIQLSNTSLNSSSSGGSSSSHSSADQQLQQLGSAAVGGKHVMRGGGGGGGLGGGSNKWKHGKSWDTQNSSNTTTLIDLSTLNLNGPSATLNTPSSTSTIKKHPQTTTTNRTNGFQTTTNTIPPTTTTITTPSTNSNNPLPTISSGGTSSSHKPTVSSGAIPKSISFDMSAEKGDKEQQLVVDVEDGNSVGGSQLLPSSSGSKRSGSSSSGGRSSNGFGFGFGKLRLNMNIRQRRGKSNPGIAGIGVATAAVKGGEEFVVGEERRSGFVEFPSVRTAQNNSEISEDILAKYRTVRTKENGPIISTSKAEKICALDDNDNQLNLIDSEVHPSNCAFEDAKKKLRIVLSSSKSHNLQKDGRKHTKKDLETFLQLEMAKAKHFKQWSTAARISETLRCIKLLDGIGFHKLCDVLHTDYCNRKVYTQYLLRSRQILLSSHSFLEELTEQVERESELCCTFLVGVCVRFYLDRYNVLLQTFTEDFKRLTLVDEKNDLLASFLGNLYAQMHKDAIWQDATSGQIEMTHIAIERSVMTEVYLYALHPNGDGDRDRDCVLNQHLSKLSFSLTPNHKDLLISKHYQNECPWLPAQEALQAMAAYKTPRDKVRCVARCACAIMDMLSLAQMRGSTTADDFIPVLVYVIIKANPQDLLSTIQYVKSFYGTQLMGEEEYWWTQFCSAVEFTKTMDYSD